MLTTSSARKVNNWGHDCAIERGSLSPNSPEARPWIALFSSLYLAEVAAADQAAFAAAEFVKLGQLDKAYFYEKMTEEEHTHARLVRSMFPNFIAPPPLSYEVYDAKRCQTSGAANLIERIAIIHLVFEPSAMAFLSYIKSEAENIFSSDWAAKISGSCASILWDEARHIRGGKEILTPLLRELSSRDYELVKSSIRSHKAFLNAGLRTFFRGSRFPALPQILNERYEFSFRNTLAGVIDELI